MAGKQIVVVHDVLGTLFDLEAAIDELKVLFAEQLKGTPDILPELIVMVRWRTVCMCDHDVSMLTFCG